MDFVKNTHGLIDTEACWRDNGPCQKQARTDEYLSLPQNSAPSQKHARIWEHSIDRRRRKELAERLLQRTSPSCERDQPRITLTISHVIGRN